MASLGPQFSSLSLHIRLYIFELALDRSPRVVEVCVVGNEVYPRSQPPALLHVNQESRTAVLRAYKPWLPQFAGTPDHARYDAILRKYPPSKNHGVSCLQHVCFDYECDVLLVRSQRWPMNLFGRLEKMCLKWMALDVTRKQSYARMAMKLVQVNNLEILYLYQLKNVEFQLDSERLQTLLKMYKDKIQTMPDSRLPSYSVPEFRMCRKWTQVESPAGLVSSHTASLSRETFECPAVPRTGSIHVRPIPWTTYKHTPGSSTNPNARLTCIDIENGVPKAPESRKRRAENGPDHVVVSPAKSPNQTKRARIEAGNQGEKNRTQTPISAAKSTKPGRRMDVARIQRALEVANTYPTPTSTPTEPSAAVCSQSPCPIFSAGEVAAGPSTIVSQGDSSDGMDGNFLCEAEKMHLPYSPEGLIAHGDTAEFSVDWNINPKPISGSRKSDEELRRSNPGLFEGCFERYNGENSSAQVDEVVLGKSIAAQENEQAQQTDAPQSISEYTPKRLVAQRENADGPEILVEWEDYPDEIDWTWELESALQQDVPDMVRAWKSAPTAVDEQRAQVYEVETIVERKKMKGIWNYLVKWKGYSHSEARTWEPRDKLRVDVPEILAAFEQKRHTRQKKLAARKRRATT